MYKLLTYIEKEFKTYLSNWQKKERDIIPYVHMPSI